MGRRKKEPRSVHRENIAAAAAGFFMEKGIPQTSMDDIAKAAGYSKATLYVYFESKEEIVSVLVLNSMKKLCSYLSAAIQQQESTREKYDLICQELLRYQEEYPFYFKMTLEKINIHLKTRMPIQKRERPFR
ncbi:MULTISPECIES: TetR/AcrR family transcriptional regulator [Hungatella]|uniref:Transcriptional regulator, TetR family n=1 Tax=Hungatella hathewayi TaxID=154046 RepID=A0A174BVJ2_9FIRM|nr:TetR/AcrR family transcriptional regulator [Hungatella effluvii]CUO04683.1 transcriptional regulator%2C TetR family [Hungatella hathewayi]